MKIDMKSTRDLGAIRNVVIGGLELFHEGKFGKFGKFGIVITDIIRHNVEGTETITKLKMKEPAVNIIAVSGSGRISSVDHISLAERFDVKKTWANLLEKMISSRRSTKLSRSEICLVSPGHRN